MSWKAILHELEQQWADWTEGWWPDDPAYQLQTRIAALQAALRRRYASMLRQRVVVERLRERLAQNEHRLAHLAEHVAVYLHVADRDNSWRHALELEQTRKALERDAEELRQRERAYRDRAAHVALLKRRLIRLRERLVMLDAAARRRT